MTGTGVGQAGGKEEVREADVGEEKAEVMVAAREEGREVD